MNHLLTPYANDPPDWAGEGAYEAKKHQRFARACLIGLCSLVLLAWSIQSITGSFKPHSDLGLSQHGKFEPAFTPRPVTEENSGGFRLESKPDPAALAETVCPPFKSVSSIGLPARTTIGQFGLQASALPAIRAPPTINTST